jgi:hypothetical protein
MIMRTVQSSVEIVLYHEPGNGMTREGISELVTTLALEYHKQRPYSFFIYLELYIYLVTLQAS